jgi:hypothetical protein
VLQILGLLTFGRVGKGWGVLIIIFAVLDCWSDVGDCVEIINRWEMGTKSVTEKRVGGKPLFIGFLLLVLSVVICMMMRRGWLMGAEERLINSGLVICAV